MRHRFDPQNFPMHRPGYEAWHFVVMLLVLGALVALIVWLVMSARRTHPIATPPAPPSDHALSEARMRYARGELSRDQYLQIVSDLGGGPVYIPPVPPPAPPAPPAPTAPTPAGPAGDM